MRFPSADEMADAVARELAAAVVGAERLTVALTGGSLARLLYPRLAEQLIDWGKVELYWGDERAVAPDHADSNYRLARETLLDRIAIPAAQVHRMRGEADDLDAAAREYEAILPPLDLVLLGMGPDGHVCSLFPGHPLLAERQRRVAAVVDSPKPPPRRLTLTLPALTAARAVWLVVSGADKQAAVNAAHEPDSDLPAGLVARMARTTWWLS